MLANDSWTYTKTMENIARAFEVLGVVVIVVGALYALALGFRVFENPAKYFEVVRKEFGRPLILGLEILVAADIIETVTVEASIEAVVILAVLVIVRIALSFSLDVEVDGVLPWRQWELKALRRSESGDKRG